MKAKTQKILSIVVDIVLIAIIFAITDQRDLLIKNV